MVRLMYKVLFQYAFYSRFDHKEQICSYMMNLFGFLTMWLNAFYKMWPSRKHAYIILTPLNPTFI